MHQNHLIMLQNSLPEGVWFLVPKTDAFQGEYVGGCDERLIWVSGFTGSGGLALISKTRALLFVDGRYTVQAKTEVSEHWEIIHTGTISLEAYMAEHLKGQTLWIDPWLVTQWQYNRWAKSMRIKAVEENPIDRLWHDQPQSSKKTAYPYDMAFAGEDHHAKRARIAKALDADAFLVADCHAVAWLLNIRGQDVIFTPVLHSYAILHKSGRVWLFTDLGKVTQELKSHLGSDVDVFGLSDLAAQCQSLIKETVLVDEQQCPHALYREIPNPVSGQDPIELPKACKNPTEIEGMIQCHIRDGVAVSRFLAWLEAHPNPESLTELDCVDRILDYRAQQEHFRSVSFETIAGMGPHGAIVHYHPNPETNRHLERGTLFLIDSGGQYLDGTTDITRTVAIGEPTLGQKRHYTWVLKGHIALARAVFPVGTNGMQLDVLARQPLWHERLDFDHGTGHGVGSFLSVHEGPQRISRRGASQALIPGMVISNEPGYYHEGHYGIRIENLVLVESVSEKWLRFKTITKVPMDWRLIDLSLLNQDELDWLNAYHQDVWDDLAERVDALTQVWLEKACRKRVF